MPDEFPDSQRYLTGKGAVGLVAFHLARRRIEFAIASDNCVYGDVWVALRDRKAGVEVKAATSEPQWHIRLSQIRRVDFFVLVTMYDGRCVVLTAEEMAHATKELPTAGNDRVLLRRESLPIDAIEAWDKLGSRRESKFHMLPLGRKPEIFPARKVTRKLADGTIKVYEYAATPRRGFSRSKNIEKRD